MKSIKQNLSRAAILAVAIAAMMLLPIAASAGNTEKSRDPYKVFLVVWRGITDAERGFMDYLAEKKVNTTYTIRDCKNDKNALPAIMAEIKKERPDLIYTFGTTTTKYIVGLDSDRDKERFITDIPVIFNIVAKPVGSKFVSPPALERKISAPVFEKKILERLEKKSDRVLVNSSYRMASRGRSYLLVKGISKRTETRLQEILLRIDYTSLTTGRNLTGCSHLVPMDAQFNALRSVTDVKKIGVIYNPAEDNAIQQVDELEWLCRENRIELVRAPLPLDNAKKPVASSLPAMVEQIASKGVTLVYIPSDSFIIAHATVMMKELNRLGIKTFSATEDPIIKGGALMGVVSHYYNVGQFAGYKAVEILVGGKNPGKINIETLKRYSFLVNMETAKRLKFYPPVSILKFAEIVKTTAPDTVRKQ